VDMDKVSEAEHQVRRIGIENGTFEGKLLF
jgi:hypothetical protein